MAIDGFMIAGPCLVSVGTGSAGALEVLGYSEGGVEYDQAHNLEPIFTDVFGPRTPHTRQDFGEVGRVTLPLIASDSTVRAKIESRGDRTALGQLNTPGLVVAGTALTGVAFRLVLAAPQDATQVRSFNLVAVELIRGKLATKVNPMVFTFLAEPFASYAVTSGKDTPIWTKSAS